MIDVKSLVKEIRAEEKKRTLEILSESETEIWTEDFEEGRKVFYHLEEPTAKWLESRMLWVPSIVREEGEDTVRRWSRAIAESLMALDPHMLITLRRIIITTSEPEDIVETARMIGYIPSYLPDYQNVLSMHWYQESTVVLNITAMQDTLREEAIQLHRKGVRMDDRERIFLTSLFYGIRHLGLSNPFLSEKLYPVHEILPEKLEEWAEEQYQEYKARTKAVAELWKRAKSPLRCKPQKERTIVQEKKDAVLDI